MSALGVKPVVRVLSFALPASAVLFVLGLLGINLYIQSPGTHQALCQALSQSLGLPVSIFRASYSPWSGLVLEGVEVQDPDDAGLAVRAQRIKARCDYLRLLRHQLIIKQIAFQQVDAKVPVPALMGEPHPSEPPVGPGLAARPREGGSPAANVPAAAEAPSSTPIPTLPVLRRGSRPFAVQVERFKVTDATLNLVARDGSPVSSIRDLELWARLEDGVYTGRMQATAAAISSVLTFGDLSSPLRASAAGIELPALQAKICGGQLEGSFQIEATTPPYRYQLRLAIAGVDVNEMGSRIAGVLERAHGTLQASLDLRGAAANLALNAGEGRMQVMSGYIDQYPLLKEIGRWTQIDELQRLELKEARSHFRVAGTNVNVDDLRLVSNNCDVTLSGRIDSAQRLSFKGRLTINQFLSQKIPNELEDNFVTNSADHSRSLDFSVTGPVAHPQTNLFDRIIGDKRKLFRKLLGAERRDRLRDATPKPPVTASGISKH
ncbi:MAG: hypothetical protein JO069_19395 [Verrucomicrobia bacterium]|nr:hypothetical protein [Verrucomicrobiota bacterium]